MLGLVSAGLAATAGSASTEADTSSFMIKFCTEYLVQVNLLQVERNTAIFFHVPTVGFTTSKYQYSMGPFMGYTAIQSYIHF
eukprot:SAG11_NODE_2877_length_2879_cov_1.997122_1_plen_82_part_00